MIGQINFNALSAVKEIYILHLLIAPHTKEFNSDSVNKIHVP
jgi:hypothetical protein